MLVITKKYKIYKKLLVPSIGVGLKYNDRWYPVEVFVDSGATYSVFHTGVAERIGLNYRAGELIYVAVGDGGLISVFLHSLYVQLGEEVFRAVIGFSDKLGIGFNLLGRKSFFERFKVCFDEKNKLVTFQKNL